MINDIDFAQMYIEQKKITTFKSKQSAAWDAKAVDFNSRVHQSEYVNDFIAKMNLDECESLLDFGCGPGTLALPLALKLKKIIAVDFSPLMLDILNNNAVNSNLHNIETINLAWEDDFATLPVCDIAISSRSLEVGDLKNAVEKLNSKAKKRVYITYKVGGSYVDSCILDYIGKKINPKPDYFYLLAILYNMGINAKVDFIPTNASSVKYANEGEFVDSIEWSLGGLDAIQKSKTAEYYHNVIVKPDFKPRGFTWAFISWDK